MRSAQADTNHLTSDFHRHLEGALFANELIAITRNIDIPFTPKTVSFICAYSATGLRKKTIEYFIRRLSTRWIRLALLKIYITHRNNPAHGKKLAATFLAQAADAVFAQAQNEGITTLNLLISPFAYAVDGDLSADRFAQIAIQLTHRHHPPEEASLYRSWERLNQKHMRTTAFLSAGEILRCIRRQADVYKAKGLTVYLTLAMRRDRDLHLIANTAPWHRTATQARDLFENHIIDLVDLCGPETNPQLAVSQFTRFFTKLTKNGTPFTIHAGELAENQADLAYQNMSDAAELGACMLGHAVRLLDDHPEAKRIRNLVIRKKIVILVNITSNQYTGLTHKPTQHPFLTPLFTKQPNLTRKIIFTLATDDPVIFSHTPGNALANEYRKFLCITGKASLTEQQDDSIPARNEKIVARRLAIITKRTKK